MCLRPAIRIKKIILILGINMGNTEFIPKDFSISRWFTT